MTNFLFQTDKLSPPIEHWPDVDRIAFLEGIGTGKGPFQRPRHVRSVHSLQKVLEGYARYLKYLSDTGQLHLQELPVERISPKRLDGYIRHLEARGNTGRTILGRFEELRDALKLMYPGQDFRGLMKPQGIPLQDVLQPQAKVVVPIDSAVLLAWAEDLFAEGTSAGTVRARCSKVRNAVLIGLLAERAPRLRALSLLRLGDSLKHGEAGWLMRQHAGMMKMTASHHIPLSPRVSRMLDRYVEVERKEMLGAGCKTSAAWVKFGGELSAEGIQSIVANAFRQRFGKRRGTHFFRHCLATTLADRHHAYPLDGATVLAHSPATTVKFYNHTAKASCARRLEKLLQKLRPGFESTRRTSCGS